MTDEHVNLGAAARALLDGRSAAYAHLDPVDLRDGVVELVAAQEAAYLQDDMPEIDVALVRVMVLEVPDVDRRLVDRLADRPSSTRLGVTCRALWQLWSPVNPHPPVDARVVRTLIAAAARVVVGEHDVGAYRAALGFAARQVEDPGTLAAVDQELARLESPEPPG